MYKGGIRVWEMGDRPDKKWEMSEKAPKMWEMLRQKTCEMGEQQKKVGDLRMNHKKWEMGDCIPL